MTIIEDSLLAEIKNYLADIKTCQEFCENYQVLTEQARDLLDKLNGR